MTYDIIQKTKSFIKDGSTMLKIYDVSINHIKEYVLVKRSGLRFGWKLSSDKRDVRQSSYRIIINDGDATIFDSGVEMSEKSFEVCYDELKLASGRDYTLTVICTDNNGESAEGSLAFATGIDEDEWAGAEWIKPSEHIAGWAPYMRTKFEIGKVKKAVMYACGLGCAEYYINGKKTDDYYIDPPMTNYKKEVLYRRTDVTQLLKEGGNAIAVWLGEGFYSQSRVWTNNGLIYGDVCAKILLDIELEDGTKKTVVTNTSEWKYKYSPISTNNIYAGETYDGRLETPDFAEYDGSEKGWNEVIVDETPKGDLVPCYIPPVRILRELPAQTVKCCNGKQDAAWIFDIGENIAGICEFHIPRSPKGAVYVFRCAEALNEHGELDHRSTGGFATQCIQQETYICRGDENGEIYRPRFTYHGFRYVELTGFFDLSNGYGKVPEVELVKGIQLTTDFAKTAEFTCSNEYVSRFYDIMDNTYRSNFHGFPEDCPAREKCGWLGDAQVVANWGLLTYDSVPSYEKYMQDIRTGVETNGFFTNIAPGLRTCGRAAPLWGCAEIIRPYYMYKYCGDSEAVKRNFDLMQKWYENEASGAEDYIMVKRENRRDYGDWCPPRVDNFNRRMPIVHSSTLIFYEISLIMAEFCKEFELGDAAYYLDNAEKIKSSFINNFYNFEKHSYGYWGTDGVALKLGLYPDGEEHSLVSALVDMIKAENYEMPTGIYANKYLVPALLEKGYGDIAYKFLFNKEKVSFAKMLDDGATSVWEVPNTTSVMPREQKVASYNHPMHGGFMYVCYTHIAGLLPTKPGYVEFDLKPCHLDAVDKLEASLETTVGKISVAFEKTDDGYSYSLTVPSNSKCRLNLGYASEIYLNGEKCENHTVLGSGRYSIVTKERLVKHG